MAKKRNNVDAEFEELKQNMPKGVKRTFEKEGINSMESLFLAMIEKGIDPMKMMVPPKEGENYEDFNPADYAIDEGSELDIIRRQLFGDGDVDGDDEDFDDDDPWDEMYELPKGLLLDEECKEYHIRVKLNNAPVNIWRELLVPSNVSLELLALLLIEAMGWENCHLNQFRKGDVFFTSTEDLKESQEFFGFGPRRLMHDANKISLGNVLDDKGERFKFEYDFGDSWEHDVWVKGIREYGKDEEPEAKLLKGVGACPPEDCGGVWGYGELLEINRKKRKTREDKERLEWYGNRSCQSSRVLLNHPKQKDVESLA